MEMVNGEVIVDLCDDAQRRIVGECLEKHIPKPYGAQFSKKARLFGFVQSANGNDKFWYDILQTHDTYGVPFDLIYLKAKPRLVDLSSAEFVEFMKMVRYSAETYGVPKEFLENK
jgi:hypothetical protein